MCIRDSCSTLLHTTGSTIRNEMNTGTNPVCIHTSASRMKPVSYTHLAQRLRETSYNSVNRS